MLNYALIGTNWLCRNYREAIPEAGEQFYAVLSRDRERGESFAQGQAMVFSSLFS